MGEVASTSATVEGVEAGKGPDAEVEQERVSPEDLVEIAWGVIEW